MLVRLAPRFFPQVCIYTLTLLSTLSLLRSFTGTATWSLGFSESTWDYRGFYRPSLLYFSLSSSSFRWLVWTVHQSMATGQSFPSSTILQMQCALGGRMVQSFLLEYRSHTCTSTQTQANNPIKIIRSRPVSLEALVDGTSPVSISGRIQQSSTKVFINFPTNRNHFPNGYAIRDRIWTCLTAVHCQGKERKSNWSKRKILTLNIRLTGQLTNAATF